MNTQNPNMVLLSAHEGWSCIYRSVLVLQLYGLPCCVVLGYNYLMSSRWLPTFQRNIATRIPDYVES
jgi:hypothetical protein